MTTEAKVADVMGVFVVGSLCQVFDKTFMQKLGHGLEEVQGSNLADADTRALAGELIGA